MNINSTLWPNAAKPHAHLCYYAGGAAVVFKTRKLRRQITGWNSASASSSVGQFKTNHANSARPSLALAF